MSNFKTGDKVKVVSECRSYGRVGTVKSISYTGWNTYVTVRLNNGCMNTYNENSLVLYNEQNNTTTNNITTKGDNNMITGNYKVAMVKFVQGMNTVKGYAFALFDENIKVNDLVLCDTVNGYGVARVTDIMAKEEYAPSCKAEEVSKEIICKVDFTDFEARKEARAEKNKIKKQMDEMLKNNQELILYQAIAKENPAMAELLEKYKSLGNV
jgi:uncharacterized phage-like protein YoqJ